ncbi:unnamed protein product [Toxocara canis]|uniref:Ig-like domain-containing protein n=1 Tax=Toxocara canis TaxID=6265 RepID=A0A183V8J3_TOXCA|nr:unnamed protein product [Toxocara canis]
MCSTGLHDQNLNSMHSFDNVTELALPNESVLSELTFIYRCSFIIEEGISVWNFCSGRIRTAYGTRAINWNVQTDGSLIEIRSFDTLDKLPEGKYRLMLNATSTDGAQEVKCCIAFSGHGCDMVGTPFHKTVTQLIYDRSTFIGGTANVNLELTFPADEFVNPKPNYVLPEIPSHLAADDYRNVMVEKVSEIRQVLIIQSQVLKFAFTGSFDLDETSVEILDEFLSCIELIVPSETRSLTEHIAVKLRRRVNKASFSWRFRLIGTKCTFAIVYEIAFARAGR